MIRWVSILAFLIAALPASAAGIAVVDFQRALQETTQGQAAQKKLDALKTSKEAELANLEASFEQAVKDYQAKEALLSEAARAQQQQTLMQQQQQLQAKFASFQEDMQKEYLATMEGLLDKMRVTAKAIAKAKSYDVVLDQAAVVYRGPGTIDMTDALIAKQNKS